MSIERRLNEAALDAAAAAVHETDFAKTGSGSRLDVLGHDRRDIARGERMQIELGLDRDSQRQKAKGKR